MVTVMGFSDLLHSAPVEQQSGAWRCDSCAKIEVAHFLVVGSFQRTTKGTNNILYGFLILRTGSQQGVRE